MDLFMHSSFKFGRLEIDNVKRRLSRGVDNRVWNLGQESMKLGTRFNETWCKI